MVSYEIRMLGIKDFLMGALGISAPTAEFLSFGIVLAIFLIPCFFMKTSNYVIMMLTVMLITVFTAIGFLPFYTWVLLSLYIAITLSGKMKGWF